VRVPGPALGTPDMSPFGADDTVRGRAPASTVHSDVRTPGPSGEVEMVDSTVADTADTVSPHPCFPTAVGAG